MSGVNLNNIYGFNYSGYTDTSGNVSKSAGTDYVKLSEVLKVYGRNNATTNAEIQSYLTGVKRYSSKLRDIADEMLYGVPPVFQQMIAASTDEDALSVQQQETAGAVSSGRRGAAGEAAPDMEVSVSQVAAPQVNVSEGLPANGKTDVKPGNNAFAVTAGGRAVNFTINVSKADSNKAVQQKMADAVNKRNISVKASVMTDAESGQSSLVLESRDTGKRNSFSIRDLEGRGSLVSSLGANNETKPAADAVFSINGGEEKTSPSNTVSLSGGLTATIKETGDRIGIVMRRDTAGIIDAVSELAENFNGLLSASKENTGNRGAQSVGRQLTGAANAYRAALSRAGIMTENDGHLGIDAGKVAGAVEDGSAERLLNRFVNKVRQTSAGVESDPAQYMSRSIKDYASGGLGSLTDLMNNKASGMGLLYDSVM